MKNIFRNAALLVSSLILGITLLTAPGLALTAKESVCQGVSRAVTTTDSAECDDANTGPTVISVIKTAISLLSWVVGIAAIIMIIIGGFKYIISSGDSANITSAKNTILYAIIGLVIVAFAQFIVRFVLAKL